MTERRTRSTAKRSLLMTRMPGVIAHPTLEDELLVARSALQIMQNDLHVEQKINQELAKRVCLLEAALSLNLLKHST